MWKEEALCGKAVPCSYLMAWHEESLAAFTFNAEASPEDGTRRVSGSLLSPPSAFPSSWQFPLDVSPRTGFAQPEPDTTQKTPAPGREGGLGTYHYTAAGSSPRGFGASRPEGNPKAAAEGRAEGHRKPAAQGVAAA